MSIPANPLDGSPSPSYKHVLIAFKYAEDAFKLDRSKDGKVDPTKYVPGDSIPEMGINVIVVNEFTNEKFSISEAVYDFDFIPSIGVSTTSSVGKIVINDRYVPYDFVNFIKSEVLDYFNSEPDRSPMSLSHATFVLKTFFLSDETTPDTTDVIQSNPYFFNVVNLESVPASGDEVIPINHVLSVVASSNSLGLARSFSSIYQLNITHKDGNIHNDILQPVNGSGLSTRVSENSKYVAMRKRRLDKSKAMLTLKDIFEGLETDLNQQKYVHQGQLQKWLREINNNHVDKIVVSPQQSKGPNTEELPIDFKIVLDPVYYDYNIDNRNMPFEQPEVRQDSVGIRTFPVRTGTDFIGLIERIMMLSKRVGSDTLQYPPLSYKINVVTERKKTDRYLVTIKIDRYEVPRNGDTEETNTGPGKNIEPLQFVISDGEEGDTDIISFKSDLNFNVGDRMLEQQVLDNPSAGIVYGDREQGTAERRPDLPFFQSLYSGIRPMIGSYTNDGLESAQHAGNILNLLDPYTYQQTTDYELVIRGNPALMSDLNRNPIDVVSGEVGSVNYYPLPEIDPMYVKLTIYLESMSSGADATVSQRYNFDNYYHLYRVTNMFGTAKKGRSFYQSLKLRRSDLTI